MESKQGENSIQNKKKKTTSTNPRQNKCNAVQHDHLVNFMATHNEFANRGKLGIRGNDTYKQIWASLTNELNEKGPKKTWQQWLASWQGIVRKARDSNGDIQRSMRQTGNPSPVEPLTAQEQIILSTVGKETSSGMEELISSVGFSASQINDENYEELIALDVPPAGQSDKDKTAPLKRKRQRSADFLKSARDSREVLTSLSNTSKESLAEIKRLNNNLELWVPQLLITLEKIAGDGNIRDVEGGIASVTTSVSTVVDAVTGYFQ